MVGLLLLLLVVVVVVGVVRASWAALAERRAWSRVSASRVSWRTRRLMASREESVEVERVASCLSRVSRVGRRALVGVLSCVGRGMASMPKAASMSARRVSKSETLDNVWFSWYAGA